MKILCTRRQARLVGGQLITSGSVGIEVDFEFSEDWQGTAKIAVFSGSGVTKDVILGEDRCIIPHECLEKHGGHLVVGVYGYRLEDDVKTIVIPTVYANIGKISPSRLLKSPRAFAEMLIAENLTAKTVIHQ